MSTKSTNAPLGACAPRVSVAYLPGRIEPFSISDASGGYGFMVFRDRCLRERVGLFRVLNDSFYQINRTPERSGYDWWRDYTIVKRDPFTDRALTAIRKAADEAGVDAGELAALLDQEVTQQSEGGQPAIAA